MEVRSSLDVDAIVRKHLCSSRFVEAFRKLGANDSD